MPKIEYIEGEKMGELIFIRRDGIVNEASYGLFVCTCGKEFRTRIQAVKSGKTKSCGCLQIKVASTVKNIYSEGEKLGNCIYLNDEPYISGFGRKAKFICQCGNHFITKIQSVVDGETKSCGCLTKKLLSSKGALPEKKMPVLSGLDVIRFWDKVDILDSKEICWEWKAGGQRYGNFSVKKSQYKSNRIAYFLSTNQDPLSRSVLHTCDNPKCCNPSHLTLGTHLENMQDMARKGRAFNGKNLNDIELY